MCVIATGRVAAYLLTSMVLIASLEVQMVATKKKSVEKAVAGASQEVLVAKIAKPAAEHSNAVKADVPEQFKAEKSVTEDRRGCSCRSIADQTRRSRKVVEDADTSVTIRPKINSNDFGEFSNSLADWNSNFVVAEILFFERFEFFGVFKVQSHTMWPYMCLCCGLFVPTQFHFECCGFRDDS